MTYSLTGEVIRWHICGCIDIKLPEGKEVTVPCIVHEEIRRHKPRKQDIQMQMLELLAKEPEEKTKLSEDKWL